MKTQRVYHPIDTSSNFFLKETQELSFGESSDSLRTQDVFGTPEGILQPESPGFLEGKEQLLRQFILSLSFSHVVLTVKRYFSHEKKPSEAQTPRKGGGMGDFCANSERCLWGRGLPTYDSSIPLISTITPSPPFLGATGR